MLMPQSLHFASTPKMESVVLPTTQQRVRWLRTFF